MGLFSGGPLLEVPATEFDCKIYRWPKRAIRDAVQLSLKTLGGVLLVALCAPIGVYLITRMTAKPSFVMGLLETFAGEVLGVLLALLALAIFSLLPERRTRHWETTEQTMESNGEIVTLLWLRSKCFHRVSYVECTVINPDGEKAMAMVRSVFSQDEFVLQPNDSVGHEFPSHFPTLKPKPGTYKVCWTGRSADGKKRVNLRSDKWQIDPPRPRASDPPDNE
jgi:hypothetical protein